MYDVIVIGARCAGSPVAMLLGRKGYRVLLLDRACFPSDTISGHMIWQPGIARLQRWGLLNNVVASNCPPVKDVKMDLGSYALSGVLPPSEGVEDAYCVRRTALDKILVDAAVAAGAELRERFSVTAILTENGRFTGIRGHSRGGPTIDEKARVVIGADGLHSLVARTAVAPEYRTRPAITCWYYSYWSGIRTNGVQAYLRERCMSILAPTNDGLTLVLTLWTHDQFHEIRSDIEGNYLRTLRQVPEVGAFLEGGRREERLRGMADVPNFFRKPYGPGWALVGDAGYHKDPVTAQGITDAFRDAELLSDALDSGFSGNRNMEQALQEYEQKRNDAVSEMYEFTCAMASLETPNAEMRQFHQALLRDQQAMDSFFGCLAGTVSSSEFLSPENRQKIIDAAA